MSSIFDAISEKIKNSMKNAGEAVINARARDEAKKGNTGKAAKLKKDAKDFRKKSDEGDDQRKMTGGQSSKPNKLFKNLPSLKSGQVLVPPLRSGDRVATVPHPILKNVFDTLKTKYENNIQTQQAKPLGQRVFEGITRSFDPTGMGKAVFQGVARSGAKTVSTFAEPFIGKGNATFSPSEVGGRVGTAIFGEKRIKPISTISDELMKKYEPYGKTAQFGAAMFPVALVASDIIPSFGGKAIAKEVVEALTPRAAMRVAKKLGLRASDDVLKRIINIKTPEDARDFMKFAKPKSDEINRVADNLIKNNQGLGRTDAEAMAKDVIANRKYQSQHLQEGGIPNKFNNIVNEIRKAKTQEMGWQNMQSKFSRKEVEPFVQYLGKEAKQQGKYPSDIFGDIYNKSKVSLQEGGIKTTIPKSVSPLHAEARGADELKQYIGSDGKITLYHGSNKAFDKSKADYGTFLTANKQEALDYAKMRASGRGGTPKVSSIKLDPSEVRLNQSTGEFQYIGESKSLSGKYPKEIYKAYNDVNGSNLTAKEIDKLSLEEVRGNASMGLEGGAKEFDSIWKEAKSQPLQEGGIKTTTPKSGIPKDAGEKMDAFMKATPEQPVSGIPIGVKGKTTRTLASGQGDNLVPPLKSSLPKDISQEGDPVKKIIEALKEAKPIRGKQEALYSKARAQRVARVAAMGEKVPGEKGYFAQLGQLKGELPKAQFESIRKSIKQVDIDSLFNRVEGAAITPFEKINAKTGLSKLLGAEGGQVPTKSELKLLNEIFPPEFMQAVLEKRPFMQKLWEQAGNVLNLPRAMMATADLSAPLRQGIFLIGKPKTWLPAFKDMFKYAFSEKAYLGLVDNIKTRPTYKAMRESKLALTDMGSILQNREEAFMSNLAEKIPIFGRMARGSNRAYTGFLNKLRADTFDELFAKSKDLIPDNPKISDDIAKFVNAATGRGDLGALNKASVVLNGAFFSPRLMASRLNLLNPKFYIDLEPAVRKEALKSLITFAGAGATILGLAKMGGVEVGVDPRSADFGKMKVGKTRYDMWGGFQQYMVLASRLISGEMVSSITGREFTLGEGYKGTNRLDIIQRFFESKASPVASFALGLLKGKTTQGEDLNLPADLADRFIPMVAQDMFDLYKEKGLEGLAMAFPAIFGVGVQTYGDQIPMESKTKSGAPSIKWRQEPGLGETLINKMTGKQVSTIPEDKQEQLRQEREADLTRQADIDKAKQLLLKTGKTQIVGDTTIYLENGIVKTTKSENSKDILDIKDRFDQIKNLDAQGKFDESDKLINELSDEDQIKFDKAEEAWKTSNSTEFNKLLDAKDIDGMVNSLMNVDVDEQSRLTDNAEANINEDDTIEEGDPRIDAFEEAVNKIDDIMSDPEKLKTFQTEQEKLPVEEQNKSGFFEGIKNKAKEFFDKGMEEAKKMGFTGQEATDYAQRQSDFAVREEQIQQGDQKVAMFDQNMSDKESQMIAEGTPTATMASTESINLGSNLAQKNNNPGNLRYAGQEGASDGSGGFARFDTPEAGYNALQKQIDLDKSRDLTVQEFVSKYAPPSENNTGQYIQQFNDNLGTDNSTKLSQLDTKEVAKFMAMKESSTQIGEKIASSNIKLNTKEESVVQAVASGKMTTEEAKDTITTAFKEKVSNDPATTATVEKLALVPPIVPYSNIGYIPPEKMYDVFSIYGLIASLKLLQQQPSFYTSPDMTKII